MCSMHYLHPCAAIATICSMGYLPPCTARCDNAGICSIYRLHSCAATWPKHSHLPYEARASCNHAIYVAMGSHSHRMQLCAAGTAGSHGQPYTVNTSRCSMHCMQPCAAMRSTHLMQPRAAICVKGNHRQHTCMQPRVMRI